MYVRGQAKNIILLKKATASHKTLQYQAKYKNTDIHEYAEVFIHTYSFIFTSFYLYTFTILKQGNEFHLDNFKGLQQPYI